MKIFLFFTILASFAQGYVGFRCVPSMRESRLQVLVVNENVQILVTNAMGYDFMPQFDGPSSIFNISFNKMQGEHLSGLGESFSFSWPKESCKLDAEHFTLDCRSVAKQEVRSIKSYGFTTTEVTEKYDDVIYDKRKFRLSLEKVNMYFVTLQFDIKTCEKFD